jgi:hypothetical protein
LFPATLTFLLAFPAWKKNKTLKREMHKHNNNNNKKAKDPVNPQFGILPEPHLPSSCR